MTVIYMMPDVAYEVRGMYSTIHELMPVPYNSGYILPVDVLTNDTYAEAHDLLEMCTTIEVEFPPPEETEE